MVMQFSPVTETFAVLSSSCPPPRPLQESSAPPHSRPPPIAEDLGLAWYHSNHGGEKKKKYIHFNQARVAAADLAVA